MTRDAYYLEAHPQTITFEIAREVVRRLTDADLCEIAAERDDYGPHAAINSLIEGLKVRHQNDRVTLAALAAVQHYHVPALRDQLFRA